MNRVARPATPHHFREGSFGPVRVADREKHHAQVGERAGPRHVVLVQLEGAPYVADRFGGPPAGVECGADALFGLSLNEAVPYEVSICQDAGGYDRVVSLRLAG